MCAHMLKFLVSMALLVIASFALAGEAAAQAQPSGAPLNPFANRSGRPPAAAATAAVPNVVGKKADAAEAALKAAHFTVKIGQAMPTADASHYNTVHSQTPPAGTNAASGTTVTLVVLVPAIANKQATVPKLIGMTAEAAVAALGAAGLKGTPTKVAATQQSAQGHVVSQTPAAGTHIPVNVLVSDIT